MQEPKRLYKSTKERMIFGVAGGLADYFEVDPVLIRLVLVLLAFGSGGAVILVYIIAAIIMPDDTEVLPEDSTPQERTVAERVEELGHDAAKAGQRAGQSVRETARGASEEVRERRRKFAGLFLIGLGGIILAANFGWWWFSWSTWWPVVLIVIGLLIIVGRARGTGR